MTVQAGGAQPRLGRLPTLTPELADRVATLVRAGNRPLAAAMACQISRRSYFVWMQRGRAALAALEEDRPVAESEDVYLHFLHAVTAAEAESEVLAITDLRKQWGRSANAVIGWLERRFPKEWSRTEKREVSGPDGGPVEVSEGPRQRLERRLERIGQRLLEEAAAEAAADENSSEGGEHAEGSATESGA